MKEPEFADISFPQPSVFAFPLERKFINKHRIFKLKILYFESKRLCFSITKSSPRRALTGMSGASLPRQVEADGILQLIKIAIRKFLSLETWRFQQKGVHKNSCIEPKAQLCARNLQYLRELT
jgi:hypothetical protein